MSSRSNHLAPAGCGLTAPTRRGWRGSLLAAGVCLVLPISLVCWHTFLGGNFHTVVPGTIYRSAQPTKARLLQLVAAYRLRTIINLRGDNNDDVWYHEEHATARALDVQVVDVGMWAKRPPQASELLLLVDTLAEAPVPILVHCQGGGDRSGLASALALLLRTGCTLAQARWQLSLYYGHNPFGRASCQDRVLDSYEEWLTRNGEPHSPARLRTWVRTVYSCDDSRVDDHF